MEGLLYSGVFVENVIDGVTLGVDSFGNPVSSES